MADHAILPTAWPSVAVLAGGEDLFAQDVSVPGMAGMFLDQVRVYPAQGQRPPAVVQDQVI
jgi:hypothetical protein